MSSSTPPIGLGVIHARCQPPIKRRKYRLQREPRPWSRLCGPARAASFPNARVSPPHPLSVSRRLGGIPLRNLAGKICRRLRANKLDCAPWVGKLDGFLGLGVGRLRIGNCGRGWCLSASASHWALAAGANSTSPRRQGRSFAALARGHIQHARRPCVRPGRGYPSRSAPSRRRAWARWLARTPHAAGTG